MLEYFTLILICQLIGEFTVTTMHLPFPGPVVGMVLLFVFLLLKGAVPEQLGHVSSALLNNLSLLFVPAGVGVMVHFELLGTDLWPLSVALIASTLLTVVVTALVMVFLNKRTAKSPTEGDEA
jgi:holin-like protein